MAAIKPESKRILGCIVDYLKGSNTFRVVALEHNGGTSYTMLGNMVTPEVAITKSISEIATKAGRKISALEPVNYSIERNGRVRPAGYKFDVFQTQGQFKPNIVLNEIRSEAGKVLGYTILDTTSGTISNTQLEKVISACELCTQHGLKAFHNAIYVPGNDDRRAHIKGHSKELPVVVIKQNRKPAVKYTVDDSTKEQAKAATQAGAAAKQESPFSKDQLKVLKAARDKGLNYQHFANPELSAEQMAQLSQIEELHFDSRQLAHPDFSVGALKFYKAELKNGSDIKPYIYPGFSAEQLMQISLGTMAGVDVSKYTDSNIFPEEMAEIRVRLESQMWKGNIMFDDVINKKLRAEIARRKDPNFTKKAEAKIDERNSTRKRVSSKKN